MWRSSARGVRLAAAEAGGLFQRGAGILVYLAQDRKDIQVATSMILKDMARPRVIGLLRLRKVGKYLKTHYRYALAF